MKTHMLSALPLALLGFATLAGCSAASGDDASSSSDAFTVTDEAHDVLARRLHERRLTCRAPVAGSSAHVRFTIASGGALSVDDVVLSLTGVAIGECSVTPWCAPLWSGALVSAQIAWAQATRSALAAQLAAHQPAWLGALEATINAAPVPVGGGDVVVPVGPPWHVVPPSLSIASGAIHYTAKREYATSVPAACKTYSACEGFIGVTCASSTDALRLQFQSAGQWTFWRDPSYVGPATTSFNWNGKGSFEEVVRVCASNSTGMSCTGPITIFPNSNHCPPINVPPPQGGTL